MVNNRKRQRSGSLSSANQPPIEERIPEGRCSVYVRRGENGIIKRTARKRVPNHTTIMIRRGSTSFSIEPIVGDTSDPEEGETFQSADSDAESKAPVVKLTFDPHPDPELWEHLKRLYLRRFNEFISSRSRYLVFLWYVRKLYEQKVKHGLVMTDDVWIQTTLAYLPDLTSWVKKKNEIIEQGPFEFMSFIIHIYSYVDANMDC